MPKEQIIITQFRGVMGSADARDLPAGAAVYALNVDIATRSGRLIGVPDHVSVQSGISGTDVRVVTFGDGSDGVYYDGTNVKVLRGLPSITSVTDLGTKSGSSNYGGSSSGEAVHLGLGNASSHIPQWVGFISGALTIAEAHLEPPDLSAQSVAYDVQDDDGPFKAGYSQRYAVSFTYDGSQESPLTNVGSVFHATDNYANVDVSVTTQNVNLRVSHINLYRSAEIEGDAGGVLQDFYRFVASEPWTSAQSVYTFDDEYNIGGAFSDRTGIPETLEHMRVNYGLSAIVDGYHVVGDCYHESIDNAQYYLFRSKASRPDTFDWSVDFMQLPFKPTALVPFAERLYAFSGGAFCIVDVESMTHSEPVYGPGVVNVKGAVVTPHGLFFANEENVYLHDGAALYTIGTPILHNEIDTNIGWLGMTFPLYGVVATYDAARDLVCFTMGYGGGGASFLWCYHHGGRYATPEGDFAYQGQWVLVDLPSGTIQGGFVCPVGDGTYSGGRAIVIANNNAYVLFASASKKNVKWESRSLHDGSQPVTYYHLMLAGSSLGTPLVQYRPDAAGSPTTANTDGTYPLGLRYVINSDTTPPWGTVRDMRIYISIVGTASIREVAITFRRRRAAR